MRTVEEILEEITGLNGQREEKAFEKYLEIIQIVIISGNNYAQIIGYLNAAALACKRGNYDLCINMSDKARKLDEEIWIKYLGEPHMHEMLATLSNAGVFE